MKFILSAVGLGALGITLLVLFVGGVDGFRDRVGAAGQLMLAEIDRFLGEENVRIQQIERRLDRLHEIRESQRLLKYQAQVRAESYEQQLTETDNPAARGNLESLAERYRQLEKRAEHLQAVTEHALKEGTEQLAVIKEQHRLLRELRIQGSHVDEVAGLVDPGEVGRIRDSITQLTSDLEAKLRAATERADVALEDLPQDDSHSND